MRLVLFLLTLFACFVGCDGGTFVAGRVVDAKNAPLKDAEVILFERHRSVSVTTRADGLYSVGFVNPPQRFDLALVASKDGFQTHVELIQSNTNTQGHVITLTPRQPLPKPR